LQTEAHAATCWGADTTLQWFRSHCSAVSFAVYAIYSVVDEIIKVILT
jgi:hypothetical protein